MYYTSLLFLGGWHRDLGSMANVDEDLGACWRRWMRERCREERFE
jgi:hypothetical protein